MEGAISLPTLPTSHTLSQDSCLGSIPQVTRNVSIALNSPKVAGILLDLLTSSANRKAAFQHMFQEAN